MNNSISSCLSLGNNWLSFSSFMPVFLDEISKFISDKKLKKNILEIKNEEAGESEDTSHANLFKYALKEINLLIEEKEFDELNKFKDMFDKLLNVSIDKEAFVLGVNYGLEINAEDNIQLLLKNCSYSEESIEILRRTSFFDIHLKNEIEHIKICFENYEKMQSQNREKDFLVGVKISLDFWRKFWEKINDED